MSDKACVCASTDDLVFEEVPKKQISCCIAMLSSVPVQFLSCSVEINTCCMVSEGERMGDLLICFINLLQPKSFDVLSI